MKKALRLRVVAPATLAVVIWLFVKWHFALIPIGFVIAVHVRRWISVPIAIISGVISMTTLIYGSYIEKSGAHFDTATGNLLLGIVAACFSLAFGLGLGAYHKTDFKSEETVSAALT